MKVGYQKRDECGENCYILVNNTNIPVITWLRLDLDDQIQKANGCSSIFIFCKFM